MSFYFKSYKFKRPKAVQGLVDVRRFNGSMLRALQLRAKAIKEEYEGVTSTWTHNIIFTIEPIRYSGGDARIRVSTSDRIFIWVDRGTATRYAVMNRKFVPKTTPGSLVSGPGAGGLAYVRRKKDGPQAQNPGIKARNFTEEIAKIHNPEMLADIRAIVHKFVRP